MALPWLYLLFAVRAALPLHIDTRATFLLLVAVLGVVGWARPARMIRGIVLSARERTYVRPPRLRRRGAVSAAAPHPAADLRPRAHAGRVLIPQYLLAEVALSFLGLGIGEPTAELGRHARHPPAVSRADVVLVDVRAGRRAGRDRVAYHALTSLVHERMRLAAS